MKPIQMAYERYKIVRGRIKTHFGSNSYSYQPPSRQEIIQIQKQQIKDWYNKALTSEQRKMIEQIMGVEKTKRENFNTEITKKLDLIENWAASLWKNPQYGKNNLSEASISEQKVLYQNLLNNWYSILHLFEVSGTVNAQAKAQLEKFRTSVKDLETAVSKGETVDYSIISRAISAANYAKGYVLEHEGKKFYSNILRELDVEVISTGQMKSKRERAVVDLAQDLVIASKGSKYQGLSLQDFLDKIASEKHNKTIVLSNEEELLLQQGIGIQAKASRDKTIRLKNNGFSIDELTKLSNLDNSTHGTMLQILFSIADKGIYIAHSEYAAIGNYLISKQLNKYLGNNMLYLLRDGLYDTYSLFENQLSKNNYAQILNGKLHLKSGSGAFGLRIV